MTSSTWRPSLSHSGALDRFTGHPQARRWLVEGVFPQAQAEDTRQALMAPTPEWLTWLASYGGLPRHPSQLYLFALEGVALFELLWLF